MTKQPESYKPLSLIQGPARIQINEEDIPNVFFTSDTHFYHKNILHFTNRQFIFRPDNNDATDILYMNNAIMGNIIATMQDSPKPILIHCGDVLFGSRGTNKRHLKEITSEISKVPNSLVYVAYGNHDIHNVIKKNILIPAVGFNTIDSDVIQNWFWNTIYLVDILRNDKVICQFTVSHFPLPEFYGSFNIHGHLHSEFGDPHPEMTNHRDVEAFRNTGCHFDCGCDNNNYTPVCLSEILLGKKSIKLDQIPQTQNIKWQFDGADN